MNTGTGNNVTDDDFLKVLLALKDNIMRSCNVSEICEVTSNNDGVYGCRLITTGEQITCYASMVDTLEIGDIVMVSFTNTDFRTILRRIKNSQPIQNVSEDKTLHTKDNGVIIGLIYLGQDPEV